MTLPGRIFVIGMMASGKSTVGAALAQRLERPYVDNDDLVEKAAGLPVAEVARRHGIDRLHELESAAVREVTEMPPPLVASIPGGAVLDADNRRLLRERGVVVWLRARVETLARRASAQKARPLLGEGDMRSRLAELLAEREPLYVDLAEITVDVDDAQPDDVVDAILARLDAGAGR